MTITENVHDFADNVTEGTEHQMRNEVTNGFGIDPKRANELFDQVEQKQQG